MNTQPVVLERVYNAPVSKVWQAITDAGQMKQWYFDLPGFRAEVGYEFSFDGKTPEGKTLVHLSKVTEVVPNQKLTYSWRYDGYEGDSFVTWELFDEGGKTRLKLTHAGLHTFPQTKDFLSHNFIQGWTSLLGTSLRNFLQPESTKDREITVSRLLNAPRELVFEVWTKPEHMARWYGPDGFSITTANMEVKEGGEWNFVMHGPDGTDYPNKVQYTKVIRPERLEYIYGSGAEDGKGDFNVVVTFDAHGNQTMLTMRSVFATAAEFEQVVAASGAIERGKETMNKLEAYLLEH